jgi:hypothetical protein
MSAVTLSANPDRDLNDLSAIEREVLGALIELRAAQGEPIYWGALVRKMAYRSVSALDTAKALNSLKDRGVVTASPDGIVVVVQAA